MKYLRRGTIKKFVAGVMAACLIAGNLPTSLLTVFAEDGWDDPYTYEFSQSSLVEAIEEAVDGDSLLYEQPDFNGDNAGEYQELFAQDGNLYELNVDVKKSAERDSVLDLRTFVSVSAGDAEDESYQVDGSEKVIFLLQNKSAEEVTAKIYVDDKESHRISVLPADEILSPETEESNEISDVQTVDVEPAYSEPEALSIVEGEVDDDGQTVDGGNVTVISGDDEESKEPEEEQIVAAPEQEEVSDAAVGEETTEEDTEEEEEQKVLSDEAPIASDKLLNGTIYDPVCVGSNGAVAFSTTLTVDEENEAETKDGEEAENEAMISDAEAGDLETFAAVTVGGDDGQVIDGYGTITVTDQQSSAVYNINISDAPTNTNISLSSKNISVTDSAGTDMSGSISLTGKLYYVPTGSETDTESWSLVSHLMLDGNQTDGTGKDKDGNDTTYYKVVPYGDSGVFDMTAGSLYLRNATQVSARADIMPIQTEILCAQDNDGNYSQTLNSAMAMTSNPQTYYYPGYEDDVVEMTVLTNGKVEEFYYGELSMGADSLTEFERAKVVKEENNDSGTTVYEYYLYPINESGDVVEDYGSLYMKYDEVYSFDVIVNSIVNEHTEDNGDVYLWKGDEYYVDQYFNQGNTSSNYTAGAKASSGKNEDDLGVFVQLARIREPLINAGTKTFADYKSVSKSDLIDEGVTSTIANAVSANYNYGISGPYEPVDENGNSLTDVTQSTVRVTGHLGDEFTASEEFGTGSVYMVTDEGTQLYSTDWIDLGAYPSDNGGRSWWYWINDYYKLNNYEDQLEFVQIVERDGQIRLEADEMGTDGKGHLYDVWNTIIFTKRDSVVKADLLNNKDKYIADGINYNTNAALPHHVQLRMSGTVETVGEDGETYSGTLNVMPDVKSDGSLGDKAPYVSYTIPTTTGATVSGSSHIAMDNDQEAEIYYFQTVSGSTTTNYYIPYDDIFDTSKVQIYVKMYFTGEISSSSGKTITYTEDDPYMYEGTLTEAQLREGYDTCPNNSGYDFAVNLSEAIKADIDTDTETILYKVWDDESNAYGSRGDVEDIVVTLERSADGENWETVMDKNDSSKAAEFTISAPLDENNKPDYNANQWSLVLTSEDLDLTYGSGDDLGYYEFRIASESLGSGEKTNPDFTYNTTIVGTTVTNTLVQNTATVAGKKLWVDADGNTLTDIPVNDVIITLYQDGHYYERTTVSKDNGWAFEFDNLPIWNGNVKYKYSLGEMTSDGRAVSDGDYVLLRNEWFHVGIIEDSDGTYIVTNTLYPTGSLKISKHVVEGTNASHLETAYTVVVTATADSVDFECVTITADGEDITASATIDSENKTITFPIKNGQTVTIEGLPEGDYVVEETVSESDDFVPIYRVGGYEKEEAPTVGVSPDIEEAVTVEIDNEYPVGTYIQVKKNYNNDVYPTGEDAFTFTIKALSCDPEAEGVTIGPEDMPMPTSSSVTITDGNAVSFGQMEFEHLGTYYYEITETQGGLTYVDYDSSVYYVKVVVRFDENSGEDYYLESVTESYAKADAETDDYKNLTYTEADTIVTAEFTNTYSAKGGLTLTATKAYEGAKLTAGQFNFTITETTEGATYTGTGTNDADGNITFTPAIEYAYEDVGTHTYVIAETAGEAGGVTYDSNTISVTVVVTDNSAGTLSTQVTVGSSGVAAANDGSYNVGTFSNKYEATGGVMLTAIKEYTGAALTEGLFNFTITETTDGATYTGTGTNDAEGNIAFTPAIKYALEDVGTHTYVVGETDDSAGGVTYDGTTISVSVEVKDNGDGTLSSSVTVGREQISAGDDGSYSVGTFSNSYKATGSVTFGGTKTIEGINSTNQTFGFALYATDNTFTVGENAEATDTQTVTGAGPFTFKSISYDSDVEGNGAGTYYYVVKETSTDENGWTMDTNEYHITVVVTDAGDGTFTLAVTCVDAEGQTVTLTRAEDGSYNFTGIDFVNTYKAAATSVQFTGNKYITNSASDAATEKVFTFELYEADSSFTASGEAAQTKTTTGEGDITFDKITYDTTGTYYYVIKEASESSSGWTMSDTVYNITVEVTDDGLGQLVATVTEVTKGTVTGTDDVYGGFDFTNAYDAAGAVTISVVKSISGVASTDKEFEFTLYNSDDSFATGDSIETIKTDGTITNSMQMNFTAIPYTKAGTYYYVIKETGTAPAGWTLDKKEYHVTVTVSDNKDGTLTTSVSYAYIDENEEAQTGNVADFTNTYKAAGSLSLTGKKSFEGGTLKENGFTFTMTNSVGDSVGEVTMDSSGTITFPTLTYDQTDIGGEYTYTITEVNSNDASVQNDDITYTVVVSVADNKDGTLNVTYKVNDTDSGDITFTNYQLGSLTITKAFIGLTDEQIADLTDFTITVTNTAGDAIATLRIADATPDEDGNYSWTVSNLPADTYIVTEFGYSLDGYEVIAKSGEVTVTDGKDVSVDDRLAWGGEDTAAFTNDYTEVGSLRISKHVVEGTQASHLDVGYTVVITANSEADVDFQWVTVKDSNGDAIDFTADTDTKTTTFTIKNGQILTVSGLPAGEYKVEETVSEGDDFVPIYRVGSLEKEIAPTVTVASGIENIVTVEIDNEYPIGTYIQVKKNYNNTVYPQDSDAFTFTIEALSFVPEADGVNLTAAEMPMPTNKTVSVIDDNAATFGPMTFEHLGTYYYKVTETKGNLKYVSYDSSIYYVKIVVSFIEDSGAEYYVETAEESYCKCDEETEDYQSLTYTSVDTIVTAEFDNTYSAKGGLTLTATKEYTGAALTEGLFNFTVKETTEGVDSDKLYIGTGTNDAKGNIIFTPEIKYTFDDVGEHTYVISETDGQKGGVTYDDSEIAVTVVVMDKTDGTLATTVMVEGEILTTGEDGSYNAGTFYNSYKATGNVTFGGEKKISGKEEELNQQFEFSLYETDESFEVDDDALASDVQTVTGAGTFTFVTIAYDSDTEFGAGTYYYLVKETSTDENGWTKDETEYHITVIVTDVGDGTFTMEVTCVNADGETVTLKQADDGTYSFTGLDLLNSYEAAETSVQFTGTKYLTNSASDNESTDKVFTFELYDADESFTISSEPIDTQTTKGAGTIWFDKITYDEVGTYYYVMQEHALDDAEGWTIDSTVYNIAVEVTDDGLGQLIATVTVNGNEIAVTDGTDDVYGGFDFTNAYAAEGEVTLSVVKSITGVASTDEKFEFTLYNSDDNFDPEDAIETITTDGTIVNSTQVNFTPIPFDAVGTYYYVIEETGKAPDGWTLDERQYQVTVTVTDNGDGTLTTSAAYAYIDEEGETQTENAAAFTNTYAAAGELALTGTKTLVGGRLEGDSFVFTMTDSTGASVGEVTMDAYGTIEFPTLTYDEMDIGKEYTYTIAEVQLSRGVGVQYDDTIYTVVVNVADNKDGTLDVTYIVNDEDSGDIEFTNYQKGSLTINKNFTGLTDEQIAGLTDFTITVKNSSCETVATLTVEDATLDETGTYSWTVKNLPADTYTVTESGYSIDGYEVIAKSAEMEVMDGSNVSADDTLDWGGEDTVEFDNDYIEVGTITISKYVVAESDVQKAHENTEYTVVLTAEDKDADFQWVSVISDSGREITPTVSGNTITFSIMEYETVTISGLPAGDYTIEETGSDAATSEHFTPIYRIGDEENENAPTVTVASGSENVVAVEIDNEYPIATYIMVQKDYNKDEYPEEGFTFKIEALSCDPEAKDVTISAKDMPMPDNDTVTITESGEIGYFGNIEYEHLGTYYYMITETAGKDGHISYDDSVYYIKVVVAATEGTHVETTDEFVAKVDAATDEYKDLEYTEAGIVTAEFANTALEELSIEKEVSGNPGDTTQYEFEITLTNPDGTPFEGTVTMETADANDASTNRIVGFFSGIAKVFANEDTVTFEDGKAAVTIEAGEKVTLLVPHGVTCQITETTTGADTTTVYNGDKVIATAKGTEAEATAEVGTIADSTQIKFVNSYRSYFPIDEEIVTNEDDIWDRDAWVKDESVNEYNAIEIEMMTNLPVVTAYDLENGAFTMNFHNVLDHELVLDEDLTDFTVYIDGYQISPIYYRITFDEDTGDDCNFHVDVDLTTLYKDGVIKEDDLQGNTEITIFFFADLEGTGLNGSYKSTIKYDIYDGDEWLYTSNESVVEVYTYEISILKYDEETKEALAGATLGIYYDEDCTEPVYRNAGQGDNDPERRSYTVTSDDDGYAIFYGLAAGTYYVKETQAPDGYTLSDEVLTVELSADLNDQDYTYKGEYANTPVEPEEPQDPDKGVDTDGNNDFQDDGVTVKPGDELTYQIRYYNHNRQPATVTITDTLDKNLEFVSAEDGGVYEDGVITWIIEDAPAESWGTVTFIVKVKEDTAAGTVVENTASVQIGNEASVNTRTVHNPTPEEPVPGPNETRDISGTKEWDDDDNKADARPASITVNLYQNDKLYESKTVTEADDWTWSWMNLPKYDENGDAYVYTITENKVEDYVTTYYTGGNFNIKNTFIAEEDNEKPVPETRRGGDTPKTGDTNTMLPWVLLMILAVLAAGGAVLWNRRSKKKEQ